MNEIKRLRERENLKQGDFAELLGVSQSTVSMWETGESKPRIATLLQISKLFSCSVDDLLQNKKSTEVGA